VLGSNQPRPDAAQAAAILSPAAAALLRQTGAERLLLVGLDGTVDGELGSTSLAVTRHDFAKAQGRLPDERFDAVLAAGIFERVPGADANWVLRALFAAADRALVVRIATIAEQGVGSEVWWRRRIEQIAAHFPKVSWELDALHRLPTGALQVETTQIRRVEPPASPVVWALTGEGETQDRQVRRIARALGGPFVEKRLAYGALAALPNRLLGTTAKVLDRSGSAPLEAPWPDVLIMSGQRAVPVATWIREQSGGRTRLVQLGRPGGPFSLFDLIIARPDDRLPIRPNVLQVAAPLAGSGGDARPAGALPQLGAQGGPWTALLLTGKTSPYVLNEAAARELGKAASAEVARHGGSLVVAADPSTPAKLTAAVRAAVSGPVQVLEPATGGEDARGALLAAADRFIITAGDAESLAEVCLTGKPVALFELPRWHDDLPVIRPLVRVVLSILGGKTYRGTPLQQHLPGRFLDWLTTRGVLFRPRDLDALYRSLEGRGLLTRLGAEELVASPKPLNDLQRIAERVRRLLSEVSQPV
jgi:mitochondrial fission protein ELM1